jgi:hypothetical protein
MVKILRSLKVTPMEAARILLCIALTVLKLGVWLATTSCLPRNGKESNYAQSYVKQQKKLRGTRTRERNPNKTVYKLTDRNHRTKDRNIQRNTSRHASWTTWTTCHCAGTSSTNSSSCFPRGIVSCHRPPSLLFLLLSSPS